MPNPNPPRVRRITSVGLKRYLNMTSSRHRGKEYDDFVEQLELNAPKTYIARLFGVHKNTVYGWIIIFNKEKEARL